MEFNETFLKNRLGLLQWQQLRDNGKSEMLPPGGWRSHALSRGSFQTPAQHKLTEEQLLWGKKRHVCAGNELL